MIDVAFDVGARLKAIRGSRDLSQRELAKRAGVTNSTISLIEQNRVSPSVSSLKKVLDGIPMTLAEFFSMDLEEADKTFFAADELSEMRLGALTLQTMGGNAAGRAVHMMREVYEEGGDTGPSMLAYPGEEVGVVVEGRVEIIVGEKSKILSVGESYAFDTSLPHRFRNPESQRGVVISASTNGRTKKAGG